MNTYKKPQNFCHVGTIDLLLVKCNKIHKIFYMSNEKITFTTILSRSEAYTKPINVLSLHFTMEAFNILLFISRKH